MVRDSVERNKNINLLTKRIEVLRKNFPECFDKDGMFDIEMLKKLLSIKTSNEGFELEYIGKSYAKLLSAIDTTTVVVPDKKHNSKKENVDSKNIYITGDNLDALKHLVKSYSGQVKCIYIDPPYNTGSDGFVYNDKFTFSPQQLQEKLSITQNEAQRILQMTTKGAASHSAWLTFMYPRLKLAQELLKENGAIFISIDDNELYNLKYICDEIFGPENFVGIAPRRTKGSATTKGANELQNLTDYIMIYFNVKIGAKLKENIVKQRQYDYSDKNGKYYIVALQDNGPEGTKEARPNLYYPIYQLKDGTLTLDKPKKDFKTFLPAKHKNTDGRWMWSPEKARESIDQLVAHDGTICIKHYYNPEEDQNIYQKEKLWIDKIFNTMGTKEVDDLLGEKGLFSNPKPVELVDWCLKMMLDDSQEEIVLDFFSGSGTTAQALMQYNEKHHTSHKFILVQLPENLKDNLLQANKNAKLMIENQIKYLQSKNRPLFLDQIGQIRVEKAGERFAKDNNFDRGFKHFVLQEPNQNTLDKLVNFDKAKFLSDDNILKIFGDDTVLATWLNADGYGLTSKAKVVDLGGYKAYYKYNHLYLIYPNFANKHCQALIEKYAKEKDFCPENIVLFGYSFDSWSVQETLKTNLKQLKSINVNINIDVRY